MKLTSYLYNESVSCGIVTDEGMIDIPSNTKGANKLHSIKEILTKGCAAYEVIQQLAKSESSVKRIPAEAVRFLAPLPQPGKVLALAGNYKEHLEENVWQNETLTFDDQATTTNPWPFMMPSTVVTGTGSEIALPVYSKEVDYEIELAIIIGQKVSHAVPGQAAACIAGYTIANDISARSVSFTDGRKNRTRDAYFDWLMGKWADGFLPLGPWLVTADEIGDPQNLDMELKVNGRTRQKSNTSKMIFSVSQIVSFFSHLMTLEPGDVIVTGTPHGVGVTDGRFLNPGDKIEATINQIGTLTNTIGPKPESYYKAFIG